MRLLWGSKRMVMTQTATQSRSVEPFSPHNSLKRMAGTTGLEPAASAVTV
jgi:hypothetical protein